MADFRIGVPHLDPFFIVPVAPLGGEVKQTADRLLQKPAAADDRSDGCGEKAEDDQSDAASRRAVDCRERFRLRLSRAQKKIARWQGRRHISENSRAAIDPDGLLPSRRVTVHDVFVAFSHILAD
jgi:hypothetical protein